MKKAVFLDRDGTINVDRHYLYKIEEFEFLPGVLEGLRILQAEGYLLLIITNQSGIGRGFYTETDLEILTNWMINEFNMRGIDIGRIYYCPHLPDAEKIDYRLDCECRKPKLGMYRQAVKDFDIDLSRSYAIGDKIRDCSICFNTSCRGFLIADNEQEDEINKVKLGQYAQIRYCKDLLEAAKMIVRESVVMEV